ncbi:hypothetical protein [Trueperella pyogenes]|uniref:hypothetical protein n=1 Tax=Trueperella pyogenes TaxID=1661 RepID=UPI00345C9709
MTTTTTEVNVGDIFASSWGYDQTNVSFYQIVKVTPKTVVLAPIAKRREDALTWASETVMPICGQFIGEAFRRKICDYGSGPLVMVSSCEYARLWDGKPQFRSSWA